jgi:hypothetical protein
MAPLSAQSWREHVRVHGDTTMVLTLCGGLTGLKEIIDIAPFTLEGTITATESKLTREEDDLYTAYEIDVIRVFRAPATAARSTPGPPDQSSPFVVGAPLTRAGCDNAARSTLPALSWADSPRRWCPHGNNRSSGADAFRGPAHHRFCVFRQLQGMVVAVRVL